MKALVIYRPNSEQATVIESFLRDFEHQMGGDIANKLETINIDSREGIATASLYDVVEYPAILVIDNYGSVINSWQGNHLPMLSEVAGYLSS